MAVNIPLMHTTPKTPPGWAEALDESLAELAAGVQTVPAAAVRRDLQDTIARMEAKEAITSKPEVAIHR